DRGGTDAGQYVAAVLLVGDDRLVDEDLQEQIVHVGVRALRARQNRDLGGQRVGAADAVDLARVGRAHDRQEQRVALGRVGRQVVGEEIRALRGAAAHPQAGNAVLIPDHTYFRPFFSSTGRMP